MASETIYKYEIITAEDTIRLILLQPSADLEAGIQCSLISLTLEQCDKDLVEHYVALSYVWGDTTAKRQVSVDGAMLEITASLDCALRHLRDASTVRRVWADGICINQDNVDDRNRQVRIMSSIYSLARHTIIFLGPGSPDSNKVMEFLASHDRRLDQQKRLKGKTGIDNNFVSLIQQELLDNRWFTRTWVLQELVLSVDPWVQCGNFRVRWETVCDLVLSSTSSAWSPDSRKHLSAMNDARSEYKNADLILSSTSSAWSPSSVRKPSGDWRERLLKLLRDRRGSGVSNPRDMIYAHLSLVGADPQGDIPIRYDLPVVDIYEAVARKCVIVLDRDADLSILCLAEDVTPEKRRDGLPSWVPDVRRRCS
jgi:hypothetical protein